MVLAVDRHGEPAEESAAQVGLGKDLHEIDHWMLYRLAADADGPLEGSTLDLERVEAGAAVPIYRVTSVEPLGGHRLRVGFDDGNVREIDLAAVLEGEIYSPLRDPTMFATVTIDHEVHTLVWANGADFDPAVLHDWPKHEPRRGVGGEGCGEGCQPSG